MTRISLIGRLAALLGVLLLMASATAAMALPMDPSTSTAAAPAAPAADTLSVGAVDVWNNPAKNCGMGIGVNIDGVSDSDGLGGYETRLWYPAARFNVTQTNSISVGLTSYLGSTNRNTSGDDSTPMLKAVDVVSGSVKFGDYSWNASGNAATGPVAAGTLATVTLTPTYTCGAAQISLNETQLVDPAGNVIGSITSSGPFTVNVRSRYDVSGNNIIQSQDAIQVVNQYGQPGSGACGARYKFDISGNGIIQSQDAIQIVNKYGQPISTSMGCVGQ